MSSASTDVLGIGNSLVDVLVRVEEDFIVRHNVIKGSMRLIDEETAELLYTDMGPAIEISGGSGANTIAGVASFGGKAAYFGKVKDDQLGQIYRHDLQAQKVHFETPSPADGPATGRCFILITPDGERTMNTYLGASVNLGPADVDETLVASAMVTYLEGYLWDPPQAKEAFKKAAGIAHNAGRKVALSLSDSFCVDRHRDSFLELIRGSVDIVFANEAEIMSLYRVSSFDEARAAAARDCEIAVLTRSEKGSLVIKGDEAHAVEAFPVPAFVDATGAGDLYAAGFLFGYTRNLALPVCARLGSLAASEVISHIGARPEVKLSEHARAKGLL